MNNFFELQSKGDTATEFTLKHPNFADEKAYNGGTKKIFFFADGERIIVKILEEKMMMSKMWYTIEDTEGNTTTVSSDNFHKIINPKNYSRKFKDFKIANHIVD